MKPSTAEYWLLKEVSNLDTFGQEMFHNTKFGYNGVSMIGVGPHGITVYRNRDEETQKYVERQQTIETSCSNLILEKLGESNKHEKNTGITRIAHSYLRFIPYRLFTTMSFSSFLCSIPYTAIQSATSQRRMFHLVYLSLDGEETSLNFKLDSSQSASGLYRAITEKHAFYSCETVRSAVTAQFIRDLKVLPLWLYRNANESINRLFLAGHYNLDIQRGLDVRKEIRVRHP